MLQFNHTGIGIHTGSNTLLTHTNTEITDLYESFTSPGYYNIQLAFTTDDPDTLTIDHSPLTEYEYWSLYIDTESLVAC